MYLLNLKHIKNIINGDSIQTYFSLKFSNRCARLFCLTNKYSRLMLKQKLNKYLIYSYKLKSNIKQIM